MDVRGLTLTALRRNIGVVFQEALLFNRSIADNLRVGKPDATEEEMRVAAARAQALEFIERSEQKFDTNAGERGRMLSGGERQRLSIARALLKDPPILILDEATSALDAVTEAKVNAALDEVMKGRTTFVIAHRLSTIRNATRILVFDDGRVIESGTFDELVAKGGRFAELARAQFMVQENARASIGAQEVRQRCCQDLGIAEIRPISSPGFNRSSLCSGPASRYRFASPSSDGRTRLKPEHHRPGPPLRRRVSKDRNRIVHFLRPLLRKSSLNWIVLVAALVVAAPRLAHAEALLVIEADTGKVLQAENATYPWYPASVTKLMTAYVTLKAVKEGRISLDTLLTVSPVAASQSPSKMGFRPGTQVTVDNALKMMLVKSANDMAVVLAEGVGGSIDGFSAQMNQTAHRLGMTQTSYVNPNGLPADGQITSARDLAILARAIIRDLPEYEYFVHIPSIRLRPQGHAEFQQADRTLSRRRRLQDRLHLRVRLQSGGVGHPQRQAADRGGARRVIRPRCARYRAAQLLERGFCQQLAVMAAPFARHGRQSGADRRLAAEPARRNVRRQAQAAGQRRGRGQRSPAVSDHRRIRHYIFRRRACSRRW